ncbi:MAG TPA: outer membrane protein assembly factor BamA [Rhabdochlamydiaceae bacterium]|nr:outer membrane protein assembly factor BamA [Rhabdochlamydiaceae bacterium]
MSKKFHLLLSLAFFTCAPLQYTHAASPAIEAYENKPIANIDVKIENLPPNYTFDPKAVLSKLKTKVGDPFSQMTFDGDLKTLADEYDRVDPSIEVYNGEVYIVLKVWPRPIIRNIEWQGNTHIKTKTLKKELGIKSNAVFNRQAFNKAFNKVKEYYIKKGYFESQLQYAVTHDPKTNEVDINIQVDEGRSGRIEDIVLKGFSKEEESQLYAMVYTKKYNLLTSWFSGTGTFNEETLDQDRLTIVNFLQNQGYADAKVDIKILESTSEGKIVIDITAERGPIYHFGQITFDGNHLFKDETIESLFIARPEGVYSPEKLRETALAIKDLYGRKGYIEANVQYETTLVENEPLYNAHFHIDEGEQYKIGLIRVFGNVQTQTRVILHESLLVPGETFDSAKLKATQERLENIGYFKSVNVYAVRTQDDQSLGENYRDVFIEIEETTTGNLSLFGGFSTADDVFGGLDLSESNFNYKGLGQIFKKGLSAVRGGGEYAHARFTVGAKQKVYSISWMTPYLRDTLWKVGFEINKTDSSLTSDDYVISTYGATVYGFYPFNPFWSFGTKYRIRNADISVDQDTPPAERKQERNSGVISAASASINYDSTDSAIKPHRGFRSRVEAEFAGIGGSFDFLRFAYVNTYYTPLWRNGIMKYRWELNFIDPIWKTSSPEKIPISERFFLGGENSVRGYRPFSLGPMYANKDPKGGISASVLSVEYMHEVFRFLDAFMFIDAGNVSLHRFRIPSYKMSYGFGIRLELLNRVPLTIGYGFPVNNDNHSQVRRFFFSMGGQF